MKKTVIRLSILLAMLAPLQLMAQEEGSALKADKPKMFSIGLGLGFSFFNSPDIDDHMYDAIVARHGMFTTTSGSVSMFLGFAPALSLNVMPIRYLRIQAIGEVRWAPKIVSADDGATESFHYLRYSPGLIVNGYLPLGRGRISLFLGGGALYHFMRFEDYAADNIGARAQFGVRIGGKTLDVEVFAGYDYVSGESGRDMVYGAGTFDFGDYSGFLGVHMYINII